MFSSTLFMMLVVYVKEDAAEMRTLVYGIVLANLVIGTLVAVLGRHLESDLAVVGSTVDPALLASNLRIFSVGTAVLFIDVLLLIVLFERLSRFISSVLLATFLTLALVLVFDTCVFIFGAFYPAENLVVTILSGILAKVGAALVFIVVLLCYFRFVEKQQHEATAADRTTPGATGLFGMLSYRQRYDLLREQVCRDPMTQLYNRGFFNDTLERVIANAAVDKSKVSLLLLDVDHFKRINDNHGHAEGDRVIIALANVLKTAGRAGDYVCRYGGEEFAVIAPDTSRFAAYAAAAQIREAFLHAVDSAAPPFPVNPITMTIGVATYPEDGTTGNELLQMADSRLYKGKSAGRDRIVDNDVAAPRVPV